MRSNIQNTTNRATGTLSVGRHAVVLQGSNGDRYEFTIPDGIGENVTLPPSGKRLQYAVITANRSWDILYSIGPSRGTHIVRFKRFAARKDADPAPKMRPGGPRTRTDGRRYYADPKLTYTAVLEIITGDFAGMEVIYMLDYIFERDADGTTFLNGTKTQVQRNEMFLQLCGFDLAVDAVEYSPNVLPDLQYILQDRSEDHPFQVEIEDGWANKISELAAGMDNIIKVNARGTKRVLEDTDDDMFSDVEDLDDTVDTQPRRRTPTPRPSPNVRVSRSNDQEILDQISHQEPPARRQPQPPAPKPEAGVDDDEEWDDDEYTPPARPARRNSEDVF